MHIKKITFNNDNFPDKSVYPFNMNILRKSKGIRFTTPVTFFIGENGSGKSTILRAISQKCGIHIWEDAEHSRYNYNHYEQELYKYISIIWSNGPVTGTFFGSQIFYDFTRFLDGWARATPAILKYFGGKSLMTQSHGESLLSFFKSVYKVKGIHFLDEPETALSAKSQLVLLNILKDMSTDGHAQFFIATHSPILLALPGSTIYSFNNSVIEMIDFQQTDNYIIYKDFLNNPGNYI